MALYIKIILSTLILVSLFFIFRSNHLTILYQTPTGKILRPLLIKRWASKFAGVYANSRLSARHIKPFIKNNGINMDEARNEISSFKTFNEFFIRKLKKEARPLNNNASILISPADSFVTGKQKITFNDIFPLKDTSFNLITCLSSIELAKEFDGGSLLLFRLAPWHYHRFHFPISCTPSAMRCISGNYDSVNPHAYKICQPLETNERCLITLNETRAGTMLMMPVGALFVGAITATYNPGELANKGDEAGYFSFGGSTILLLAKPGSIIIDENILNNSLQEKETPIKMGESVAKIR